MPVPGAGVSCIACLFQPPLRSAAALCCGSGIRRDRGKIGAAEDLAHIGDVLLDLLRQRFRRRELFFLANPLDKIKLHVAAVEIAVKVEDIAFNCARTRAELKAKSSTLTAIS